MGKIWIFSLFAFISLLLTWCMSLERAQHLLWEDDSPRTWIELAKPFDEYMSYVSWAWDLGVFEYSGHFYSLEITWDALPIGFSLVTNDPTRKIGLIKIKDYSEGETKNYECFYFDCDKNQKMWDSGFTGLYNIWYSFNEKRVALEEFSDYHPIWMVWGRFVSKLIGYTSWYLVAPPYKLPVDAWSFRSIQEQGSQNCRDQIFVSEDIGAEDWCRRIFQSSGLQYLNYIGDDKDRVYFREEVDSLPRYTARYVISRVPKGSDFKLLSEEEFDWIILRNNTSGLEKYPKKIPNGKHVFPGGEEKYDRYSDLWTLHHNYLYFSYKGKNRRFPVDGASLKIEKFSYHSSGELWGLYVFSDKEFRYILKASLYLSYPEYYEFRKEKR